MAKSYWHTYIKYFCDMASLQTNKALKKKNPSHNYVKNLLGFKIKT